MEQIKIRCRSCGKELEGISGKSVSCSCSNMATIIGEKITAVDLGQVVMLNSIRPQQKSSYFTEEELAWQQARANRKIRKLEFEVK